MIFLKQDRAVTADFVRGEGEFAIDLDKDFR